MKKTFRVGMALLLVLALLLYLSPVRVSASALPEAAAVATKVIPFAKAVEPAALGIGGSLFCWVAAALGVGFTVYSAVEAYNSFQDYSGMLETSIYYYPDGSWSFGVDMTFVEKVRAFLFDSGTISYTVSGTHSFTFGDYSYNITSSRPCDMVVFWYTGYSPYSGMSVTAYAPDNGEPLYLYYNGKQYGSKVFNGYSVSTFYKISGSIFETERWYTTLRVIHDDSGCMSNEAVYEKYFGGQVAPSYTVSVDAQLGVVAPPEVDIPSGYPDWYGNSRPAVKPDTQEEITVLPIPLNPSADPETEIGTLTQPDIWQGTIADPMPDMQPDPNPDPGTNPDSGTDNEPWQDWLTPSGEPGRFGIQLRDYFPFCIPFDLYDFLTVLAAEPEAPCFEWEIPVPQMGRTFTVEVDLSEWDSVAALFRKLELLAFIVGLGWVTREKIRG